MDGGSSGTGRSNRGDRTGVVIAGGRSTRFGDRDKAVADLAGTPMIRRVADRIAGVVDSLVVNCRDDQVPAIRAALAEYPLPVAYATDDDPDQGPTAGIRNGLRAVETGYAVVVACDMPFVDPDLVDYLFERAAGHDAAVPRLEDGWYQTTQAVYRAESMADACDTALEKGERKIIAPLEYLDWVVVEDGEVREHGSIDSFENVNTREEFDDAVQRLS